MVDFRGASIARREAKAERRKWVRSGSRHRRKRKNRRAARKPRRNRRAEHGQCRLLSPFGSCLSPPFRIQTGHSCLPRVACLEGVVAVRGTANQRRERFELAVAPFWRGGVASRTVSVAGIVGRAALGATACGIRINLDVGRDELCAEEAAQPGVVGVSEHFWGLQLSRRVSEAASATRQRRCNPFGLERQICGRLSGCHASPNTPTGLADGFGDGSHLPGSRPDTPQIVVPPFGVTTDSACTLYHKRRPSVLTKGKIDLPRWRYQVSVSGIRCGIGAPSCGGSWRIQHAARWGAPVFYGRASAWSRANFSKSVEMKTPSDSAHSVSP